MMHRDRLRQRLPALFLTTALAVVACGGSDEPASPAPAPAPAPGPPFVAQGRLRHVAGPLERGDGLTCLAATDGMGAEARFRRILAMTEAPGGSVVLSEWSGSVDDRCLNAAPASVRKVDAEGRVTTLAQGEAVTLGVPKKTFFVPTGVAASADGSVFIGDGYPAGMAFGPGQDGDAVGVWKLSTDGRMTPFVGIARSYAGAINLPDPVSTFQGLDGRGTEARFINVERLAMTSDNVLYVQDFWSILRRIGPDASVTTVAESGYVDLLSAPGGDVYGGRVDGWRNLRTGDALPVRTQGLRSAINRQGNRFTAIGQVVYRIARDGTRTAVVGVVPAPLPPECSGVVTLPVQPPDPHCRTEVRGNEPGPLPAHLGQIEALTAGADGSLYILADGALLKATFGH